MFQSEMPTVARYGIYVHALLGAIALIAGAIPIMAVKGGQLHRRAGRVFFVSMLAAIAFAIPAIVARRNLFLGLLLPFTLFMLLRGWRIAQARLGRGRANSWPDYLLLSAATAVGVLLLGIGLWRLASGWGAVGFAGVFVGVGVLILALAASDLRTLRSANPAPLSKHAVGMLGAYTAALTAFTAVNFPTEAYSPVLVWLTPPLAGSLLIAYWVRRLRRQPGSSVRPSDMTAPVSQ